MAMEDQLMALTTSMSDAARALGISLNAIKRAIPYHDPALPLPLTKVTAAFGVDKVALIKALDGDDEFLTIAESAALLGISVPSFERDRRFGRIAPDVYRPSPAPCHRVVRFSRAALLAYRKTRETGKAA
jgi:hypothetical protein